MNLPRNVETRPRPRPLEKGGFQWRTELLHFFRYKLTNKLEQRCSHPTTLLSRSRAEWFENFEILNWKKGFPCLAQFLFQAYSIKNCLYWISKESIFKQSRKRENLCLINEWVDIEVSQSCTGDRFYFSVFLNGCEIEHEWKCIQFMNCLVAACGTWWEQLWTTTLIMWVDWFVLLII